MKRETLTIGQICQEGELPRVLLVIVEEKGEHCVTMTFLVYKVIRESNGDVIVDGAYIESNCRVLLDQNTKVIHFCT